MPQMAFSRARVKSEQFCFEDSGLVRKEEPHQVKVKDFIIKQEKVDDAREGHGEHHQLQEGAIKRKRRTYVSHDFVQERAEGSSRISTTRAQHRCRLDALLKSFMREQRWHEAAGVLSVLLRGSPSSHNISEDALRRYHTAAMELHKQLFRGDQSRYQMWVSQIFHIWMSMFSRSMDDSRKKHELVTELALFYFRQENIEDAQSEMQLVIQDHDLAKEPYVNLLYGMILYQLWYSHLPNEYKIKDFNVCVPIETYGGASNNGEEEMDVGGSSNHDCAAFTEGFKVPSYASESSFGNDKKVSSRCKDGRFTTGYGGACPPQEFYMSQSTDINEPKSGLCNPDGSLRNSSVLFSNGLDTSLLPISLRHLTGDLEQKINQYRRLADKNHSDAIEHLRLALHSVSPISAALLPLIQLLLLGDRVDEAFEELEIACGNIDTALPFRLMARLLECFQSNKITQVCSYYETALRRNPICYHSLESLMKMHKSGNCSAMLMFEMIALHLDAASGKCNVWEEFALCFLQLRTALQACEDCFSQNVQRGQTRVVLVQEVPKAFTEKDARVLWKLRFGWWRRRHFCSSSLQAGNLAILCFKAACAAHIYGPSYEYVGSVFRRFREENDDHASILNEHMQKAMNLFKHL